jgi:hypothetical protein
MSKFRVDQIAPDLPLTWALTERFLWEQKAGDALGRDVDGKLLGAAYGAVDWEAYYERLKGTPFHDWAVEGGGILTFGRAHDVEDNFFSAIGDVSSREGDWLEEHPEFNQVLHDVHVEIAEQMIGFVLRREKKRQRRRRKRSGARARFKKGDSVVVKAGIADPDYGVEIGGWQGRLGKPPEVEGTVFIHWDSVTLRQMPDSAIEQCEEQGLDWTGMALRADEVELTSPRDTEKDVAQAIKELSTNYAWYLLGEEGKRIRRVLVGVDAEDIMAALAAWERHLREKLTFPFKAEIVEHRGRGPLQMEDCVTVREISAVDDLYGIVVCVRFHRRRYDSPLCDLEVSDEHSPNHQIVQDYSDWFANR